jgi:hypothetical protein
LTKFADVIDAIFYKKTQTKGMLMIERTIVRWILALLFLAITTYPSSPFFYQFLVGNPVYAYLVILFVFFICSILLKNKAISISPKARINTFSTLQALVFVSLITTLITTQNTTAVRDLLTYAVVLILLFFIRDRDFIKVLTTKYLLASILVAVSIVAYTLLVFFPEIRLDWLVSKLSLNEGNPIVTRHEYGDFRYSMLFYYSTVLFNTNTETYLLGSIFAEPTHVFAFLLGPLFFCLRVDRFKGREFVILTLIFYMMYTLSLYPALILLLGSMLAILLLSLKPSNSTFKLLMISLTIVIWFGGSQLLLEFLKLIPQDKAFQFDYYFGPDNLLALTSGSSIFGLSEVPNEPSWGSAILIFRYGYFGFFVWASLVVFYLVEACKFLFHRELSKTTRFFSFMALFSATLMGLKVPNMLLITSLLIYVGLGYLNKLKSSSGQLPT